MTRIGMIVPSSNTSLEPATTRLLANRPDVTIHYTRIPVRAITLDGTGAAFDADTMVAAARLLADAEVDCIAWNGTAGSWLGLEHDQQCCAAISEATGIPATTSTLGILQACHDYGISALACATPYTRDVVDAIMREYARHDVTVVSHAEWELTDNLSFAKAGADAVAELLVAATKNATAEPAPQAVALICTNVDGTTVLNEVEKTLGTPVFDSIAATLWWALELTGSDARIPGAGLLLEQGSLRHRVKEIVTELRERTGCDRTTARIDDAELGLHVDLCAAESCAPGVRSIQHDPSLDQRKLETVSWLEANRKVLVQPTFAEPPYPPQALREVYGVSAQVLGPVERGDEMAAWLSAHSISERPWSDDDLAAMTDAQHKLHAVLNNK
ncbi:Asp/Glu racemase [Mycolicibacterium agri]|uniref:Asp/Glu racemase n=1 Tax=Mycolicibacterium agri TaxID=36811 RepID=A0A2A7NF74_MYCAG|nr:GAF domain-containing protein [Mycolicibacterium agri]PEG42367.1 Asp/Glu racemase [Mycolicibacterium agri]GFG51232.1 Asp/Glu racemase [Mycolicibacterium agri]